MGNSQTGFEKNWKLIVQELDFKVLQNQISKEKVRLYTRNFENQGALRIQQALYKNRKNLGPNAIKTLHYETLNFQNYCSDSVRLKLYTQHAQKSLQDIRKLDQCDLVVILQQTLKGMKNLSDEGFGKFCLKPANIFILEGLKVKVWINRNLSFNFAQENVKHANQHQQIAYTLILFQTFCQQGKYSQQMQKVLKKISIPFKFDETISKLSAYSQYKTTKKKLYQGGYQYIRGIIN